MMLRVSKLSRNRMDLKIRGGGSFRGRATSTATLEKWLVRHGFARKALTVIVDRAEALEEGESANVELDAAKHEEEEEPFTLFIRENMAESASVPLVAKTPLYALDRALSDPKPRGDLRWVDRNRLCVLDLDAHNSAPITSAEALGLPQKLQTRPDLMWVSKGRGLHLIYTSRDGLTAYARACAGAIECYGAIPRLTSELLANTRFPPIGVEPLRFAPSDGHRLNVWRSAVKGSESVTDEEKLAWLSERELSYGRFPHTSCPIDPCQISGKDPVDIGPNGITCFRCKGLGDSSGWVSWGRLLAGKSSEESRIEAAALARVTWEHARFVVNEDWPSPLPDAVLANGYRILCIDVAADCLKPHAARVTASFGIVRGSGGTWLDAEALTIIMPKVGGGRIASLPSVMVATSDGAKCSAVLVDRYSTNQSLVGWPEIVPVRGVRMWEEGQRSRYLRPVSVPEVPYPPRYVPPSSRSPFSACVASLLSKLPGLDERYLTLCVLARAYAESGQGPLPVLLVTGPTGAGKSAVVRLAAAMLGDQIYVIPDNQQLEETVGYGSSHAGFLLWDEFGKNSFYGRTDLNLFDPVLRIERNYTFRMLYVGPMRIQVSSAIVLTNTQYSSEAMSHQQAARRMIYLPMTRRVPDWRLTIGEIERIRYDKELASLADDYVSWIKDTYLVRPLPWFQLVTKLGFHTLEEYNREGIEASLDSTIIEFFKELYLDNGYPDSEDWIEVPFNSPAGELWMLLADGSDGAKLTSSTRVRERDLLDLLGFQDEDADNRALRFSSQRYSEGVRVSLTLTDRHKMVVHSRNRRVLSRCQNL